MKVESTEMQERAQQLWRELDGLDWSSHEQVIVGILRDALEEAATVELQCLNNAMHHPEYVRGWYDAKRDVSGTPGEKADRSSARPLDTGLTGERHDDMPCSP